MLELLTQLPCANRIGWALVHSLWQFALVALLATALQRALARRSALARYWTLLAGLVLLIVMPIATWFSLESAHAVAVPNGLASIDNVPDTSSPEQVLAWPGALDVEAVAPLPEKSAAMAPAVPRQPQRRTIGSAVSWSMVKSRVEAWLPEIVLIWLVGVSVSAMRPLLSWRTVRRLRTAGISPGGDAIHRLLRRTAERLGVVRAVQLFQSTLVPTPVLVGYFRPVILLPLCVVSGLPEPQLELILAHELAHIRRHDYLINLCQTLIESLFFYHPAVWWLSRQIRIERENCCDDVAMSVAGSREDYGRALLAMEELRTASTPLALAARGGSLLARIQRIAGCGPTSRVAGAGGILGTVAITIGILAVAAWATASSAEKPEVSKPRVAEAAIAKTDQEAAPARSELVFAQSTVEEQPSWIRGANDELEMLLTGHIVRNDGGSTKDAMVTLTIKYNSHTFEVLTPTVEQGRFQAWLPVGKYPWYSIIVSATCSDGARNAKVILRQQLRQFVKNGLDLHVARPTEAIELRLVHDGEPVVGGELRIELEHGTVVRSESDEKGLAHVKLVDGEKVSRLTAWSGESLIGGLRTLQETPGHARSHTIQMYRCQPLRIEAKDEMGQPIVGAELSAYAYAADREYFGAPDGLELVTDEQGHAIISWFPDLDETKVYVNFREKEGWYELSREQDDATYQMVGKRSARRYPITGNIRGAQEFVGGFSVLLGSFQHEQEETIDLVYALSNPDGSFSAEVLPDATYAIFLEDDQWVADPVDLIPYESDSGRSNSPVLMAEKGTPVRIRLTQGSDQRPIPHTWVNVNSAHSFTWMENGRSDTGALGRRANSWTDEHGIIDMVAPVGSLDVQVVLDDWRGSKEIEVLRGQDNEVHIHRKVDETARVVGKVFSWPAGNQSETDQVAGLEVHVKAIDGESGDDFKVKTDDQGQFEVETTATMLGAIVFTDDKRFAGTVVMKDLKAEAKIQLYPTKSYSGQVVDSAGQPVANHNVWANIRVMHELKHGTVYPSVFATQVEGQTDSEGRFSLRGLPCKVEVILGTATLDHKSNEYEFIDKVYFLPDDESRESVKMIGENAKSTPPRTLAERYKEMLRDCRLNEFHLMVIAYDLSDKSNSEFVNRHLLDDSKQEAVASFMQLKVDRAELGKPENAAFVQAQDWTTLAGVLAIAYDGAGKELGRAEFEPNSANSTGVAFQFIEDHRPPRQDAEVKWKTAFATAEEQDKFVWIRTGQRYCGPCFRLSRWLDDHREVLEKDFVTVKVDELQDVNGAEISERLAEGRSVGVPFQAIFDPSGKRITDSYGATGNIGYMSGFEGKRHFRKMMDLACKRITEAEIESLLESLED